MDKTYLARLGLRQKLLREYPDVVRGVNIQSGTPEKNKMIEEALCEWYAFVMGVYLPGRYPGVFRLVDGSADGGDEEKGREKEKETEKRTMLESLVTGLKVPLDPVELMESSSSSTGTYETKAEDQTQKKKDQLLYLLDTLGTWVDEDFLILLPSPSPIKSPDQRETTTTTSEPKSQYHLEAYTTYYPAGFDTRTKLARPLSEIHGPVPGYKQKLEKSMDRFFEKVEVGRAVVRVNWSVMTPGTGLFAAFGGLHEHTLEVEEEKGKEEMSVDEVDGKETFLRCERQTLHRLPGSRALLFGFHTYAYPLEDIKAEGLGEELAVAIDGLKEGNVPEVWQYKRGAYWGEAVEAYLRS